jgi:SAM-dependent methyltransferase
MTVSDEPSWIDYYDEQGDREPRELLLDVLGAFGEGGREAVDLGCGQGIDTVAMLERGWRVFAVDGEPEGIRRLHERVPSRLAGALRAEVASMEDVALPTADLVWASFSLFFCPPDRFAGLWAKVRDAVRPGGRFAGQLLGDRDTWASKSDISAFARADAERLLDGLEIERFEEEEEDGEACSGPKHWHYFEVVARRPA